MKALLLVVQVVVVCSAIPLSKWMNKRLEKYEKDCKKVLEDAEESRQSLESIVVEEKEQMSQKKVKQRKKKKAKEAVQQKNEPEQTPIKSTSIPSSPVLGMLTQLVAVYAVCCSVIFKIVFLYLPTR